MKKYIYALSAFLLFSCTYTTVNQNTVKGNMLINKENLKSMKQKEFTMKNSNITISFDDEKVYGMSGVNRYFGTYTVDENGNLKFGPIATTMMAADPESMKNEQEFLKFLSNAKKLKIVDKKTIEIISNDKTIIFENKGK